MTKKEKQSNIPPEELEEVKECIKWAAYTAIELMDICRIGSKYRNAREYIEDVGETINLCLDDLPEMIEQSKKDEVQAG